MNDEGAEYSHTPLHYAIIKGHIDIAEFLMEAGVDLYAANANEDSPMDLVSNRAMAQAICDARTQQNQAEVDRKRKR